ncbi:hypothetical protein ACLOJK_025493 [Asimina triloba]
MRIRRRWLLQYSTSPMPSNPQLPVQQRQIGGAIGKQQQNMVEARSAGLHPNHEFLPAIASPKYTKNQPQSLPRSEDDEEEHQYPPRKKEEPHVPPPPPAAPAPSTGSTKSNRGSWLIHPDHGGTPKEINRTRPPNQSQEMKAAIHHPDKGRNTRMRQAVMIKGHHPNSICSLSFLFLHGDAWHAEPVGRWSAWEKAFPFKKRRSGGYDRGEIAGGETVAEKKNMRSKVKRNIPNRYEEKQEEEEEEEEEDDDDDEEEEDDEDDGDNDDDYDDEEERAARAAKIQVMRRKRRKAGGGVLKRGSRCSRVNGRGWQCSRLTLVGYSLCEHHLGKGRSESIGNMVGIRRRSASRPSRNSDDNDCDLRSRTLAVKEAMVEEDNQKKEVAMAWPLLPMMVVKKKKRGRRLGWKRLDNSSLLGQAHRHPTM